MYGCPKCGSEDIKDKGSFFKCLACGQRMECLHKTTDGRQKKEKRNMIKKERYGWKELKHESEFREIDISKLNVGGYQRGEASRISTRKRASEFDFAAAGTLVIAEREDGSLWIVDGLQRKIAAETRGDVRKLPCMVFKSLGEHHEAKVFLLCNKGRTAVSALQKYRASVRAGISPEKEIDEWVRNNGMLVSDQNSQNDSTIRFPASITQAWRLNQSECKEAILITQKICKGSSLNSAIFEGVWYLLKYGVDVGKYLNKIDKYGGKDVLLKEINAFCIMTGKKKTWTTSAAGILSIINKRKHKKIHIQI